MPDKFHTKWGVDTESELLLGKSKKNVLGDLKLNSKEKTREECF